MTDVRPLLPFTLAELLRRVNRRSYSQLHSVVAGKKACTANLAIAIEEATAGAINRSDLRPDLWPHKTFPPSIDRRAS
jgi:DNA-binding transcriptional regulator YdaS (Cro superfamily)